MSSSSSSPSPPSPPKAPAYRLHDRVFHRLDCPPKAREAREWVHKFLSTHAISERPPWDSSKGKTESVAVIPKKFHPKGSKGKEIPKEEKQKSQTHKIPKNSNISLSASQTSFPLSSSFSSIPPRPLPPRSSRSVSPRHYVPPIEREIAHQEAVRKKKEILREELQRAAQTAQWSETAFSTITPPSDSRRRSVESLRWQIENIAAATEILKSKEFKETVNMEIHEEYNEETLRKFLQKEQEEKTDISSAISSLSISPPSAPPSIRHIEFFPIYRHPGDWMADQRKWTCCNNIRSDSQGCVIERYDVSKWRITKDSKKSKEKGGKSASAGSVVVRPLHSGKFEEIDEGGGERIFQWSCCGKNFKEAEGCLMKTVIREDKWQFD